jgi:hypothetical protein
MCVLTACSSAPIATPPPTIEPTATPNPILSIEWVESLPVYSIQSLDGGGSQSLVEVIINDPTRNTMEDVTTIYAYLIEDIFALDTPAPLFISIIVSNGTTKTIYEQLPGDTQLSSRPLE